MKNHLKDKIVDAFESETPDFREKIIATCKNEKQAPSLSPISVTAKKRPPLFRWIAAATVCTLLFLVGFSIGYFIPDTQIKSTAETRVYLDVNPSLALSLDENNVVLSCSPTNTDAEIVLNDLSLEGVKLKTALTSIVSSMYVNGFLTVDDNAMLVSVDTNDTDNTNGFLTYITNQVNEVFANSNMRCAIIAQGVNVDDDLRSRADEYDISVGKMHLLDKMIYNLEYLSADDLPEYVNMSIKDLNIMYTANPNENPPLNDELISGNIKVEITKNNALAAVLKEIEKTECDIEESLVFVLPSKRGEQKIVYAVTLKFYNDSKIYKYEVDCKTGKVEISPSESSPDDQIPDKW